MGDTDVWRFLNKKNSDCNINDFTFLFALRLVFVCSELSTSLSMISLPSSPVGNAKEYY